MYAFTSIFAPTKLKKSIAHRWTWYNPKLDDWEIVEDIKYDITGGRDKGFRGYTYKNNVWPGEWKIQVITDEELVIGVIDFEIINSPDLQPNHLVTKTY